MSVVKQRTAFRVTRWMCSRTSFEVSSTFPANSPRTLKKSNFWSERCAGRAIRCGLGPERELKEKLFLADAKHSHLLEKNVETKKQGRNGRQVTRFDKNQSAKSWAEHSDCFSHSFFRLLPATYHPEMVSISKDGKRKKEETSSDLRNAKLHHLRQGPRLKVLSTRSSLEIST